MQINLIYAFNSPRRIRRLLLLLRPVFSIFYGGKWFVIDSDATGSIRETSGLVRYSKLKQGCLFITLTVFNVINVSGSIASAVKSSIFCLVKRDLTYVCRKLQTAADAGLSMEITLLSSPLLSVLLPDTKNPSSPPLLRQISCHRPLHPFLISHGSRPELAIDPGSQVGLSTGGLNQAHV